MGFRYNRAVFDEQTAPRRHPSVIKVIVSHHFELRLVVAARVRVRDFLSLDMRVEFLLPVLESHC